MLNLEKEKQLFSQGYEFIAGIDEVGRGPLAGPVVAACVVVDKNFDISTSELEEVRDSKKLSSKKREKLFGVIRKNVVAVGIGSCSSQTIDKINILQASLLACKRSLEQLNIKPNYVLIDGKYKIPKINLPQETIIGGDNKIFSIAAASIIAKVSRDYTMTQADQKFPQYGFASHKGYGTKFHIESINMFGICPIHRLSFTPCKNKKSSY